MAKWGEGDPRWIVEERPDATNVNNWHWTEKNACNWSVDKLKELLTNFRIESEKAKCKITEVEKCEGEAVANNRKGKLIFFYEWDLTLKWKGTLKGSESSVEGTINIPNLSEENDVSEVDVNVSVKNSDPEADKLKEFMYREGSNYIRKQLGKYVNALKEEFSKGMILPRKEEVKKQSVNQDGVASLSAGFTKQVHVNYIEKEKCGLKIDTSTVKTSHKFQCKGDEFYNVMTTVELLQAFTRGAVKAEIKKGGKFELFGGNIHGEFVELVPNTRIVQRWRLKQWPAEHYSNVTIDIDQKEDHTQVSLTQTGVPRSELDLTKENWDRYYWDSIKRTFGFGSFLV
ncbi:hypothetical protein R5R35_006778 [Gryllus longicercus]|uniref:Activator of Hsp90 ATPase AHSA1-like N-terminal domain-containing protein n=1 Tax=Gryllus longicercus TaxID=2509291 RepID=A0AAN9VBN5_9ORTH|nr:uncharacterized protein GBIM_17835 [Gryllus bimaculatus]